MHSGNILSACAVPCVMPCSSQAGCMEEMVVNITNTLVHADRCMCTSKEALTHVHVRARVKNSLAHNSCFGAACCKVSADARPCES